MFKNAFKIIKKNKGNNESEEEGFASDEDNKSQKGKKTNKTSSI